MPASTQPPLPWRGLVRCQTSLMSSGSAPSSCTRPVKCVLTTYSGPSSATSSTLASRSSTRVSCVAPLRSRMSIWISANISGVVKARMSSRLPASLAACRRMKLTLALRTKAATSKSAGMTLAGGTGTRVSHATRAALGRGGALAHDEADHRDGGHHQQTDHQHVGQAFAEAEVRGERGQAQAGGEAGDRAHPLAAGGRGGRSWGAGSGSGCCGVGGCLGRCGVGGLGGRGALALHAKGLAAADAPGFGVHGHGRQADGEYHGQKGKGLFHGVSCERDSNWQRVGGFCFKKKQKYVDVYFAKTGGFRPGAWCERRGCKRGHPQAGKIAGLPGGVVSRSALPGHGLRPSAFSILSHDPIAPRHPRH